MQRTAVAFEKGFHVLIGDARSQAGTLVIEPGKKVGGPNNRHRGADQWIYVAGGTGQATIGEETFALVTGTLVLIERGEAHGFHATGATPLEILTFYVPPAYDKDCNELPAGMP